MTATTSRSEISAPALQSLAAALDYGRFDAIAELAHLAASYWISIREAADRGERLPIEVHCRQVAAVTRETFATVKALGSQEAEQ
jgi:hypothetical protein